MLGIFNGDMQIANAGAIFIAQQSVIMNSMRKN